MTIEVRSWGNVARPHAAVIPLHWRHEPLPPAIGSVLPQGLARSYGDSCLNEGNTLLSTAGLDRLIAFDRGAGTLTCEAGVTLHDILALAAPAGWFLPVVPGTANVTVGGAIANDVHGKNHHAAGSFGKYVRRLELLRSDGSRVECAPDCDAELFRATVGGLGLTGLVTWAELALQPVASPYFDVETRRMADLDEFFAHSAESDGRFAYTVAWIDALAQGEAVGRGVFMRANHAADGGPASTPSKRSLAVPFDFPAATLNRHTVRAFNAAYRSRAPREWARSRQHYGKYLFPLDAIGRWNRLYGARGLLQHQSVLPRGDARALVREMLGVVGASGEASFLSVLKVFGDHDPVGLLSFPRPGVTLALDVPMRGAATLALLERLDAIVRDARGAIYPAKDARMSPQTFRASFPRWEEFRTFVDPAFSSSFWRRVTG